MSDLTSGLLAAAAAHCERTGMSHARLATIVINDGKFFDRVRRGGGLTVKTYERFMTFFREGAPIADAAAPTAAPEGASPDSRAPPAAPAPAEGEAA